MAASLFRYPAVAVRWLDAHARNQAIEYTEDEAKTQYHRAEEVLTLGLLLKEDEKGIQLYCEETGPSEIRGVNFIPAPMIKEVYRFGFIKPARRKSPPPIPQPAPT